MREPLIAGPPIVTSEAWNSPGEITREWRLIGFSVGEGRWETWMDEAQISAIRNSRVFAKVQAAAVPGVHPAGWRYVQYAKTAKYAPPPGKRGGTGVFR